MANLAAGDLVITADGRAEPIGWIGSRAVDCERHPKPETVWPVRVSSGAFGAGLPERDLWLSPDHAVFVNNVLVPVKLLINGTSIAQVKRTSVTDYHVELPRHEVIRAEGLPVESYLDTCDRADFGGDVTRLFPDFAARLAPDAALAWETRGAAPLVMSGEESAGAKAVIAANTPRWDLLSVKLLPRPADEISPPSLAPGGSARTRCRASSDAPIAGTRRGGARGVA